MKSSLLSKLKYLIQMKKLNKNNSVSIPFLKNFKIHIEGKGNYVNIAKGASLKGRLDIFGNNNKITIQKGYPCHINLSIGIDKNRTTSYCVFKWHENTYCGSANIIMGENNSEIIVEKNCLISDHVDIYCTDGHTISNLKNKIMNVGRFVHIGEHVWIGKDVKIGKNTSIPKNSVIGWGSIVTKQFNQENTIIAGNPAKIVKENIIWKKDFPNKNSINKRI